MTADCHTRDRVRGVRSVKTRNRNSLQTQRHRDTEFYIIEHKDTKKQSSFAILEDTESSKAAFYKGHKDG